MKRVFQRIVSVFMLTVLNMLLLGIHSATVLPRDMGHSMGTSHKTSPLSCFTSCTTATLHQEEVIKNIEKDENDKPWPPFFVQFQVSSALAFKEKHSQQTKSAIDQEPPPDGVPAYIGLAVFRA